MGFFPLLFLALGVLFGVAIAPRLRRYWTRTTTIFAWILIGVLILLLVARNIS